MNNEDNQRLHKFQKTPFKRLVEYKKQGVVISCSFEIINNDSILEKVGLVSNHNYLLVKLIEYKGRRFDKLRNPWGNFVRKGELSNDSPLWTKEMKRTLKISNAERRRIVLDD